MRRLFARWFGWRYVLLEYDDENFEMERAFPTDSGWVVRLNSPYVMLLPDGKVRGHNGITRWHPCFGWDEAIAKLENDRIPLPHPFMP